MSKLKSQWEFQDLFAARPAPPSAPARRVLSVSELTSTIKGLLEQQVGKVWVTGELSNLRIQSSGHAYFCLKDANAQLNCVLFRGEARAFNRDLLRDGVGVNLQGQLTVYETRGQYQLIVSAVELQGVGALQAAFEKLKQKLQAEGLFLQERKRPLPRFPQRVGIVTSPTGAAIRDVFQVIQRRHPGLEVLLASCRVQGQGAGEEIACAIALLNEWHARAAEKRKGGIDLILLTRGGGSLEDLWAFNEEVVARAIVRSAIPVVSAVGHEIDFTISDFVADFRAATPSVGAEIITEGFFSSRQFVYAAAAELRALLQDGLADKREDLRLLGQRLQRQHPRRWLQEQWQRLDDFQSALVRSAHYGYRSQRTRWLGVAQRLLRVRPSQWLAARRDSLKRLDARYQEHVRRRLQETRQRLSHLESRLRLLSPRNVLERGYSITQDAVSGQVIRSHEQVTAGQKLRTLLKEGQVSSRVELP